ncbi:MAG TPA: hypothetical protein VLE23_07085, partial [Geminicoccaceae bacterium]|nr:hypothetical protein [Geminicoccaceae bacterium]
MWSFSGVDAQLGRYGGTLEIRPGIDGRLQVIRVVSLAEVVHADARAVDLVWTGGVQSAAPNATTLSVALR